MYKGSILLKTGCRAYMTDCWSDENVAFWVDSLIRRTELRKMSVLVWGRVICMCWWPYEPKRGAAESKSTGNCLSRIIGATWWWWGGGDERQMCYVIRRSAGSQLILHQHLCRMIRIHVGDIVDPSYRPRRASGRPPVRNLFLGRLLPHLRAAGTKKYRATRPRCFSAAMHYCADEISIACSLE